MLPTRALSILQPWLHFIVDPACSAPKRLENRPRRIMNWKEWTPKGEFWLHAGKGDGSAYWTESIDTVRSIFGEGFPVPRSPFLPRGGIVGRCRIVGMVSPEGLITLEAGEDDHLPDMRWHVPGEHAYVLADVVPVPFVACRGMLGFWPVKPEILAELARAAA